MLSASSQVLKHVAYFDSLDHQNFANLALLLSELPMENETREGKKNLLEIT